jgi:hypothetical protein
MAWKQTVKTSERNSEHECFLRENSMENGLWPCCFDPDVFVGKRPNGANDNFSHSERRKRIPLDTRSKAAAERPVRV